MCCIKIIIMLYFVALLTYTLMHSIVILHFPVNRRIQAPWLPNRLRQLQPSYSMYKEEENRGRFGLCGIHYEQYSVEGFVSHDRYFVCEMLAVSGVDGSGMH